MKHMCVFMLAALSLAFLTVTAADLVIYEGEPKVWEKEPWLTFKGPWDLTDNRTISIDLENTSQTDEVRLAVDMTGQSGSRCRHTMIPAGFKGTVDIDVCPKLAHPDVAARLKLMRTTPFLGGDREKPYDVANVPTISLTHHHPSLVQVANQQKRAEAYARYLASALESPNVVGTHWHQFSDQPLTGRFDGENFNVGFTDVCDIPYPEMRAVLRAVGATIYARRFAIP